MLLNTDQGLRRRRIPQSSLPLFPSLLFLLSGGSECSGLHVLSRCLGIGENIKVKRKRCKPPGNSTTCVSIYVGEFQRRRNLFAYKGGYFYSHTVRMSAFINVFVLSVNGFNECGSYNNNTSVHKPMLSY